MNSLLYADKLSKYVLEREIPKNVEFLGRVKDYFFRSYQKKYIVNNCSLSLAKGETIAVLGKNGAGKSTLIKMMTGVIVPSSGELVVCNAKPHLREANFLKNIGVVFGHKNSLMWDLPLFDSLNLHKVIYHLEDKYYKSRLNYLLEILNLTKCLNSKIKFMSLGERVKANLVMNLLHEPVLVFLDEPTIGVDIESKNQIREFINYEKCQNKTSFVMASHDPSDIENCCDHIYILSDGEMAFSKKTEKIKDVYKDKIKIIVKKDVISQKYFNNLKSENNLVLKEYVNTYSMTFSKNLERIIVNSLIENNITSFELRIMTFEEILADMFDIAGNINNEDDDEFE
ncbi:MAG: ATP-binding cassette domain-containing protein [Spirobacillus cienkowskii]|uniref:ATP-binding cassette domain-containing protein n=1 Tax=Spirobacillus cienkowskii TaxID=495820 RepID=A0A369KL85_9BACT|nr:MAG: ATP-binding cassette domain-containing protein [Spirobacillus cienkowskii]